MVLRAKEKTKIIHFCFVLCLLLRTFALTKPALMGRAGQDIDGILRPTKPFVRLAEGKRRLRTLLFCEFKLRKLETIHRGNATMNANVGVLYPQQ